uniref:Small ribosomal subunit protein mS31 n=1 Tax=Soboliphyme baturini TaxID=241478 RepID=A0A183IGK3_9BILA
LSRNQNTQTSSVAFRLGDGPKLDIFDISPVTAESEPPLLPVWRLLDAKMQEKMYKPIPRNGFEEMIQWTEEGKLYPYPVNNEYMFHERNVPFYEHIFLENLIKDGFPSSGPIRHFMELVTHGLSKNPFMSIEKKRDHIDWFKQYFKEKKGEIDRLHEKELAVSKVSSKAAARKE